MSSWKRILLPPCYRFCVSARARGLPQLLVIPLLFVPKLRATVVFLYLLMAITALYSNMRAVSAARLPYSYPAMGFLTRMQNNALIPNRSTGSTGGLFKVCEAVSLASGTVLSFYHAFAHSIMCSGALSPTKSFVEVSLYSPPTGIALLVSFLSVFLVWG